MFLVQVGVALVATVFLIGWASTYWPFGGKLEPAFIGALVGASGTIFAACVAYSAASQNLEIAQIAATTTAQQRIEGEKAQRRFAKEQAVRELQSARELLAFCDRYIALFDGAVETGARDFYIYMTDALRDGTIVQYMMGAQGPIGTKATQIFQSFYNVRMSVEQAKNRAGTSDQPVPERAELNKAIRDRVADIKRLRGEVDEDVRRRERAIDAMPE